MLQGTSALADETEYTQTICPLERNGTALYLSQTVLSGTQPRKQILLVHGVTYSSHEFDIDYQDYSLVRLLARNGYGVWQLDIAGFGRSGDVEDGFMVDSDYAADDFQRGPDGSFDASVTDPAVLEWFCSGCWHYDGESSPNGGRRDLCVDASNLLIDLTRISMPTLVICGDQDPYLNYDLVNRCLDDLPDGSVLEMIPGGSHVVYIEKPWYHDFQERLLRFLQDEISVNDMAA